MDEKERALLCGLEVHVSIAQRKSSLLVCLSMCK